MSSSSHHRSYASIEAPIPRQAARPVIPAPRLLRWLVPVIVVYVALLVALPIQMAIDRDALAESIVANTPDLNPDWLGFAVVGSVLYAAVLHGVDAVLAIWFTAKVLRGRQWARIALTIYLLIALPASLISAAAGHEYLIYVIPSDLIHVAILVVLWLPQSVRQFFAAHRFAAQPSVTKENLS